MTLSAVDAFLVHHRADVHIGIEQTIADGLRTSLGSKTFPIISDRVDEIITVSEAGILQAMRIIWERMKIVVEPSAAVPLGAILEHLDRIDGRRVGVLLSGGNVDLEQIGSLLQRRRRSGRRAGLTDARLRARGPFPIPTSSRRCSVARRNQTSHCVAA